MEIKAWIVNRSKQGEVFVFRTEPPMTKEILDFAKTLWGAEAMPYSVEHGLLIVRVSGPPSSTTLHNIAVTLTEAQTHVKNAQNQAQKAHERFVKEVTDRTGLPAEQA
jgi:hypothetical protein